MSLKLYAYDIYPKNFALIAKKELEQRGSSPTPQKRTEIIQR